MLVIHKSGLVITDREQHFKVLNNKTNEFEPYDGDARFVVWNADDYERPKEVQGASYLPTLIKWLDMKYQPNPTRVSIAERNVKEYEV